MLFHTSPSFPEYRQCVRWDGERDTRRREIEALPKASSLLLLIDYTMYCFLLGHRHIPYKNSMLSVLDLLAIGITPMPDGILAH